MMNKPLVGAWLIAIGAILGAIANTPSKILSEVFLKDLALIGNTLQAAGGAFIAGSEETLDIRIGNQIKAIGNLTSIRGLFEKDENIRLIYNSQGNLIQAVGIGITLNFQENLTLNESLLNVSLMIRMIGSSLHALSNKKKLENVEGADELITVAVWIKAVGAVLSALIFDKTI